MLFIVREDYLLPLLITEREVSYKRASSAACLTPHSPSWDDDTSDRAEIQGKCSAAVSSFQTKLSEEDTST